MKREAIGTGKTIDDAIEAAALELGVDEDELDGKEVLETPSGGFLGIGKTNAKVRVWVGEDDPAPAPVKETESASVRPAKENRNDRRGNGRNKQGKPRREKEEHAPFRPTGVPAEGETAEAAKKYFTELCALIGLPETEVFVTAGENKTMRISLAGEGMGLLIGKRGETMYALQYLASLALNKKEGEFTRIELDIEGYREKRTAALQKLALRMADKAVKQKRNVTLEYMQAYERRVIHSTLQDYAYVTTRSIGEEPFRKVVIVYSPDGKEE